MSEPTSTLRPTLDGPDYKPAATAEEIAELADESGCPPEPDPANAGWDLSLGARINYGRNPDGALSVRLHLGPDYDGSGIACRAVTPAQLVEHARHLLLIAQAEVSRNPDTGDLGMHLDCVNGYLALIVGSATTRHIAMASGNPEEAQ